MSSKIENSVACYEWDCTEKNIPKLYSMQKSNKYKTLDIHNLLIPMYQEAILNTYYNNL